MRARDYAIIGVAIAIAAAHAGWRLSVWYGVLPCFHACYWCGKSLAEKCATH